MSNSVKYSLLQTSKIANKHNLWDLYGKSNLKYSRILDDSQNQKPKQLIEQKQLLVKQPKYLARSLLIIFIRSQQQAFKEIRNIAFKRKLRTVRLPLFQNKFKKQTLQNGFLALKNLTIIKTQKNIQLKISERRNPNVLIRSMNNLTKSKLTEAMRLLKVNSHRIRLFTIPVQNIHQVLCKINNAHIQAAFNVICAKSQHSKLCLGLVKQILRIQEKAIRRIKAIAFNHLIQSSLTNVCKDQRTQRQQKIKELSEKKNQQHKVLLNLRQTARTLQSTISAQGFQKNRLSKEHTKQLRMLKAKTQEDCKQLQKQLALLQRQQSFLAHQMSHKESYLNRRLKNKRISQNFLSHLEQLVESIKQYKSQQFRNSDAVRRLLPVNRIIQEIDQFNVHENLRMKEEIRMYEGLNSRIDSPQIKRSKVQNERIRSMIEILVDKQLDFNLNQKQV